MSEQNSLHYFLMPFTAASASQSKMEQVIKNLTNQINQLQRTITRLTNEKRELQQRIDQLEQTTLQVISNIQSDNANSPILKSYLQLVEQNIIRQPNGRRYNSLQEFFTLLSFMGPHYYGILNSHMLCPTYRTVLSYKSSLLQQYGITNDLFDGSIENILKILSLFLPENYGGKLIIMVDAAYITPYVEVKSDGTVNGLLNCKRIPEELANQLIESEPHFLQFIQENKNFIIQAEYGIMLSPTDPQYKPFPIGCIRSTSGKASEEIIQIVESLIVNLRNLGLNIIGLGTDGDNAYNKYSAKSIKDIFESFNQFCSFNVVDIVNSLKSLLHFSDPFHLTKRDRYRKISNEQINISPNSENLRDISNDLAELGIPYYILDDNDGRKMEDSLPKKLFNMSVFVKIMEKRDIPLIFSMLPSTLLLESLHSEYLSRQNRIDYLLFGACLIILYYMVLKYVITKELDIFASKRKIYRQEVCFTEDWCIAYIMTTLEIASLLCTEKSLHLGALGDHFMEHGFANIRRHCKGDNTDKRFISSMKSILLEKILTKNLKIEDTSPSSRSDSGQIVNDDMEVVRYPMIYYLRYAKAFLNNIIDFPTELDLSQILPNDQKMPIEELSCLFGINITKSGRSISTKTTCMISTGGLANARIWNAANQMKSVEQ